MQSCTMMSLTSLELCSLRMTSLSILDLSTASLSSRVDGINDRNDNWLNILLFIEAIGQLMTFLLPVEQQFQRQQQQQLLSTCPELATPPSRSRASSERKRSSSGLTHLISNAASLAPRPTLDTSRKLSTTSFYSSNDDSLDFRPPKVSQVRFTPNVSFC